MKNTLFLLLLLVTISSTAQWQDYGSPAFSAGQVQYVSLATNLGTPYVAYRDQANLNKCTVMKHNGTSWVNVGTPGFSGGGALYTSLAIENGFPFVAYVDGSAVNRVTVKAFDGTNWLTIGTTGFSGDNTSFVNLAFESSEPYVAYQDGSNGNKISVMKYDGANWVQIGAAGFSAGVASEISLTFLGPTPYVSFKDGNASDELSVMYFDGTNWQYVGSPGITSGGVGKTSLSHDGTDIHVAFQDVANGNKVTVMKYNGSWQLVGAAAFSSGAVNYIDLEFLGTDPYIAYQDAANGFRATVKTFDGTNWVDFGLPGFTTSQALFTSLAFDGGYPMVAFQDYAGGAYKASVMKYEPCFDADMPTLSLSQTTICKNVPLTLSITSGNLNSADYWSVYTGGCGSTLVGSFAGSSAILLPQGNTTYFVRGEPACGSPLSCTNISVTVIPVDSSVTVSGGTLTAVSSGGTYEWLDCNNGYAPIAGETNQSFTVSANGSYAMKISENGCVDTSSCYTFTSAEISESLTSLFDVYPNPANDELVVQFNIFAGNGYLVLTDLHGRKLLSEPVSGNISKTLDISQFANGIYQLSLINGEQITPYKIVIQH